MGELVSVLYGPCAGVKKVALDPLPPEVGGEEMIGLVSLSRERFVMGLTDEHEPTHQSLPRVGVTAGGLALSESLE